MSDPDASSSEMPFLRESPDELDESLLDALLNGQPLPSDAPEQARVVAKMLASLAAPADPSELAGEAAARSAFARSAPQAVTPPVTKHPSRRRQTSWLPPRISARLAVGLVAAAIGIGGAAAGYADVLPEPIQDLAHFLIHAPSPRPPARQKQQHPADHKSKARQHPAKPGTAAGNGNAKHRRKAHHSRPHHHQKAGQHVKANHQHKAHHSGGRPHGKVKGHVTR